MRKNVVLLALTLGAFLAQAFLHQLLPVSSVVPHLVVVTTVSFAFMRGQHAGILIGAFSGLLCDFFLGGGLFGMHTLILTYIGFFSASLSKKFFDRDMKMPLLLTAAGDLVYCLAFYFVELISRRGLSFPVYFRHTVLSHMMATVLACLPLYPLFYLINSRITARDIEEQNSPWLRR